MKSDAFARSRFRPSWPVWVILVGVVLGLGGEAGVARGAGVDLAHLRQLLQPQVMTPRTAPFQVAAVLGLLLFAGGVVAYVIRGSTSRARAERGYGSLGTILACLGFAIIVANVVTLPYFIASARQSTGLGTALSPGAIVLSVIALDGSLVGVVYVRIVRPGVLAWRDLGWTTSELGRRISLGLIVGAGSIATSSAIELLLQRARVQQNQLDLFAGVQDAPLSQFVGVLLAAAVIVPVCEETFFRGYVFSATARRHGVPAAVLVSSLLFAIAHTNLAAFLPLLAIGVIFALVYARTGSLVPTMVAHAMINGLALLALYFGPH